MHDPFPLSPPTLLVSLVHPLANNFGLTTLPLHIHEVLLSTFAYHIICAYISPWISRILFPRTYPKLSRRTKLNWDVHVVSLAQSLFINTCALWVMGTDRERAAMGWEERIWGYTGGGGMVQGMAAGYFLWDLTMCVRNVSVFGWGLLAHAIAALVVFSLGFRPFLNFYGPTFILYELSSPFLNFHWFFDKLHMTGSRPQWYNGIVLLFSFFCCRLLWGTYQSIRVYQDVWAALHYDPSIRSKPLFEPARDDDQIMIMRFAKDYAVPTWLACVYLGSNVVLNTLNFYWFGKMIETIKKRFREGSNKKRGAGEEKEEGVLVEGLMDSSTLITEVVEDGGVVLPANGKVSDKGKVASGFMNGGSFIEVEQTHVRHRD